MKVSNRKYYYKQDREETETVVWCKRRFQILRPWRSFKGRWSTALGCVDRKLKKDGFASEGH